MIVWTDYLRYRAKQRGFRLATLERILDRSAEKYIDTETGRMVVIGRDSNRSIMIACEVEGSMITPITVHAITRQQIRFRIEAGRFTSE